MQGKISYYKFLEGIKGHVIDRIAVEPDMKSAQFYTPNMIRGQVDLPFDDPNLMKLVVDNGA